MKKFLLLILILFFVAFFRFSGMFRDAPESTTIENNIAQIASSAEFYYRQTHLNCGSYAVAMVQNVLSEEKVEPEDVVQRMKYKIPRIGTHPDGLVQELSNRGLKVEEFKVKQDNYFNFLRIQLTKGSPVIILGDKSGVQHYITILGHNISEQEFYIYDSWHDKGEEGMTLDSNGGYTGNKTLSHDELFNFWSNGGMYGFYSGYALVVSP